MNDTFVTVVGNVVDSPRLVRLGENGTVTNFRMASTARRYDVRQQEFVDAGTFWVDVECFNDLSGNVSATVSKGDPVIVHGALATHSWETENGRRSNPRVKAFAVGPNLARGTAEFRRTTRPARPTEEAAGSPAPGAEHEPGMPETPDLVRGRDYEGALETLEEMDATEPTPEPAHA